MPTPFWVVELMLQRYRIATELMEQIRNKEIRILSDRVAIIRNYSRIGMDELFMSNGNLFPANHPNRVRNGNRAMAGSLRPVLEQSINCAMICHEVLLECSSAPAHTSACERCKVVRVLAENCFRLGKHLVQTGTLSELLLLRCVAGCNSVVDAVQGCDGESMVKCAAACERCKSTCIEFYQKVLAN